jgi:hypothetical protein
VDEISNLKKCSKSYKTRIENKSLFSIESNNYSEFTLLIKGDNEQDLKKLKKIIKFSCYVAHHLKLETEFFFDESGIYSSPLNNEKIILSVSPFVHFPHPIDPNIKISKSEKRKTTQLDWNKLSPIIFNIQNHQNIVILFTKLIKIEESKFKQHGDPEIIIIAYYTEVSSILL